LLNDDEFAADFCPGVNVLIGGNGTGKTTLLKSMYEANKPFAKIMTSYGNATVTADGNSIIIEEDEVDSNKKERSWGVISFDSKLKSCIYIPEKDILEHAKGLLPFIEQKETGFSQVYKDVLVTAQDVPTQIQTETQQSVGKKISRIIDGKVEWVASEGTYYTIRTDGLRIPFANEASGFKKLGYLGLVVASGYLETDSVLFWDEPENSLNPEYIPILVDILLELSRNGVQIFIATHDYNLVRYFDVRKDKGTSVLFHNLSIANDGQIICNSSSEYIKLTHNKLESASADLFKAVVADAMEVQYGE